jgi:3-oxoacyl-(acyl-carrier-protein) synthase
MGIVAPNGVGLERFENAIMEGRSGIRHIPVLEDLNFRCTVGGIPPVTEEQLNTITGKYSARKIQASGVIYACLAAQEAWDDAGLKAVDDKKSPPLHDHGCILGTGQPGIDVLRESFQLIDGDGVKRLGSTKLPQTMSSAPSAFIGGMFGLGNRVTTVSSACCSGSDSIIAGWRHIRDGGARIMLCGGTDSSGPYIWAGFDSMRVLNSRSNDHPEKASCPMSEHYGGFVPGGGAAVLVLEEMDSALERGAKIYGEVTGGFQNCGGHRESGSMTAPNTNSVVACISGALESAGIDGEEVDLICGHLTSTKGDVLEVAGWSKALGRKGSDFPYINSLKSMTGHCLSAAGALETVAALLQLHGDYVHANPNLESIHPGISEMIDEECIPRDTKQRAELNYVAKANFGFGDVNTCIILKKFHQS